MRMLVFLLLLSACAAEPARRCELERAGTLPVFLIGNVPVTVAIINGQTAALVLDTGSDATVLEPRAAARLGIPYSRRSDGLLQVVGRRARTSQTVLAKLQLAEAVLSDVPAVISGQGLQQPIDGVLGINVLSGFEVDLDAAGGQVTLYRARPCAGLPAWSGPYAKLDTQQQSSGHLLVPAALDGHALRGTLDTGTGTTTIGLQAAEDAELTPEDLRGGRSVAVQGTGPRGLRVWPRRFRLLEVGPTSLQGPVLNVADLPPEAGDLIIGNDYLATRRVWIALGAGAVFVGAPSAAGREDIVPMGGAVPSSTAAQPRPR